MLTRSIQATTQRAARKGISRQVIFEYNASRSGNAFSLTSRFVDTVLIPLDRPLHSSPSFRASVKFAGLLGLSF
jgi:hypothetical protein